MVKFKVVGAGGRLGSALCRAITEHGYELTNQNDEINYLVFAHRYRGEPSFYEEINVTVELTANIIDSVKWASGDRAIVVVSSVCATDPVQDQSLAYNVSKAGQVQLARYYAKTLNGIRCNTVSPAAFTGASPVVAIAQVVDVIMFLCSPAASGINGQDLRVTG